MKAERIYLDDGEMTERLLTEWRAERRLKADEPLPQ
jgi:hypothetical protein